MQRSWLCTIDILYFFSYACAKKEEKNKNNIIEFFTSYFLNCEKD